MYTGVDKSDPQPHPKAHPHPTLLTSTPQTTHHDSRPTWRPPTPPSPTNGLEHRQSYHTHQQQAMFFPQPMPATPPMTNEGFENPTAAFLGRWTNRGQQQVVDSTNCDDVVGGRHPLVEMHIPSMRREQICQAATHVARSCALPRVTSLYLCSLSPVPTVQHQTNAKT